DRREGREDYRGLGRVAPEEDQRLTLPVGNDDGGDVRAGVIVNARGPRLAIQAEREGSPGVLAERLEVQQLNHEAATRLEAIADILHVAHHVEPAVHPVGLDDLAGLSGSVLP